MMTDLKKINPNLAFAGACGADYSLFISQRTQRRKARQGKKEGKKGLLFARL